MDDFEKMMSWGLGENWKDVNPKKAHLFFAKCHPEYEPLQEYSGISGSLKATFYIYQIAYLYHKNVKKKSAKEFKHSRVSIFNKLVKYFRR